VIAAAAVIDTVRACSGGRVKIVPASDAQLSGWLQEQGAVAALVRPDRYVAALARQPDQIEDLFDFVPGLAAVGAP
jgi:hypothetical protein